VLEGKRQHPVRMEVMGEVVPVEDINARLDEGTARLDHDAFDDAMRELHTLFNGKKFQEFDESTKRVANDRERLFRR
ncbi:hypothetical protein, partial [Rhizobium leguminosarum]|uniref:hypothetical protein n=1 Tax=Rhizobium leguminosarum TaxID=384 RepID=UPI003F9A3D60